MRNDPPEFARLNTAPARRPRFVVAIIFDVGSIYCTSHSDISGVPGIVMNSVLERPAAISQKIVPDEGRSEIGSFSFSLIDKASVFTNELRAKLDSGRGLRNRVVRFYVGFEGLPFSEFQLFQTQIVRDARFADGRYDVNCQDVTREARKDIFEVKSTTLRLSVSATDTTIPVYNTVPFVRVAHGASYSDAPNLTVGYIQIEKEVIRYTGTTADTFTGCTRGVLNTKAVAHQVDAATAAERRTKVEELIYLELPTIKMAYAILTGQIHGTANTLPAHWHLGISPSLVRLSDFTNIGVDLWNTADDTQGFILRFVGLKKQDGKRFLEKELYLFARCFSPVYADGALGLRRMSRILRDAPGILRLTRKEITRLGDLEHDLDGMHNQFRVNWSHDGQEYKRVSIFQDSSSISKHGFSAAKTIESKGLYGARDTDATILTLLDGLRDRYSEPPEKISISVQGSLNAVEVGDVIRIEEQNLRDFAGPAGGINRAFEIQQRSIDFYTGEVSMQLFGSTVRASILSPTSAPAALPDAFYTSQGTALSSVVSMTGNSVNAGTYDITGTANLNDNACIFYHDGPLTIPQGATIRIAPQAQFRVRGFVTVNGVIDLVGRGRLGVVDAGPLTNNPTGTPGFIGTTQGCDGLFLTEPGGKTVGVESRPAARSAPALHTEWPYLQLKYEAGTLRGIPNDLRGTSGGPGGKVNNAGGLVALGGTGGPSGGGFALICRGLGFGASGRIDTSGGNGAIGNLYTFDGNTYYSGGGAPGLAGGFLCLLDGSGLSIPDVTGKYFGASGIPGYQLPHSPAINTIVEKRTWEAVSTDGKPFSGWPAPDVTHFVDSSNAMHRIQYIPAPETANIDAPQPVPAPTFLTSFVDVNSIVFQAGIPESSALLELRVYASINNDRSNAVLAWRGNVDHGSIVFPSGTVRYLWASLYDADRNLESAFFPTSATAGVIAVSAYTGLFSNVFLDTFEHQNWQAVYNDRANISTVVTYPTDGEYGGRVLQATNQLWIASKDNIPYEPDALYKITARMRRTVAGAAGLENAYVGVEGVAGDGVTFVNENGANTPSGQHYNAARQFDMGTLALGAWRSFVGYFRGFGTSGFGVSDNNIAPTPLRTGVRYFRPLVILNYDGGVGTQQIDYLKVERLTSLDNADNSDLARPIPDAEFSRATDQRYWKLANFNGIQQPATGLQILSTGGVAGGLLRITGDGIQKAAAAQRTPPFMAITSQTFSGRIRWRRVGTLSWANPADEGLIFQALSQFDQEPYSAAAVGGGAAVISGNTINAATSNQWQETTATFTVSNAPKSQQQYPYFIFIVAVSANFLSGVIEVDAANAWPA